MCGILFVQSLDGSPLDAARLSRALPSIRERGPDYDCLRISKDRSRALFSATLRVARRPFAARTHGSSLLGFNGELYGFPDSSLAAPNDGLDTDTVRRFCESGQIHRFFSDLCVDASRGFFAFVYAGDLDATESDVLFATDVLGEKSLYLLHTEKVFALASTHQALVAVAESFRVPMSVDPDALRRYFLTRNLIFSPNEFIRPIRRVPPGQVFTYSPMRDRVSTATPDPFDTLAGVAQSSLEAGEDEIFRSDIVPAWRGVEHRDLSTILSGGIDSTVLSAEVAGSVAPDIPTLTLTFGGRDPAALEAARIAELLGLRRHQVIDVTIESFAEAARGLYLSMGSPLPTHSFPSFAIIADWVSAVGARVVIGGDGLDEIANGYSAYDAGELRRSDRSISEYSRVAVRDEVSRAILEGSPSILDAPGDEISRHRDVLESLGISPEEASWGASKWLDVSRNLYATGLLAADLVGGTRGIEGRSPWTTLRLVALHVFSRTHRSADGTFRVKEYARELFARHLPTVPVPPKYGFSGFPNEAARILLPTSSGGYSRLEDVLGIRLPAMQDAELDRRLEWKLLNCELWLAAQAGELR